ncbi:MAG: hypothetical protein N2652_00780 [Kiritimatiellae bacterium]|nr:hypothetical protein [Kiritimatiellia bacterium]
MAKAALERGWEGIAELRRLAVNGPAEVAPVAMRAWADVRWQVLGTPATGALFAAEESAALTAWETLVAERGASAMAVALRLSETAGFTARAMRLLPVLLTAVSPADAAGWIASQKDPDLAGRLIRFMVESVERSTDAVVLSRVVEILLLLWQYDEALRVAERAYATSGSDEFVRLAATALRRSDDGAALASAFDRLYRGRSDRAGRERELVFWIRVAAEAGRAEPIRGRLRPADLLRLPSSEAATVVRDLTRLGLAQDAQELLSGAQSPFQIYLRAWVARVAGDPLAGDAEAALEAALVDRGELKEDEALATADVMDRLGDSSAAARLWSRIVESAPRDTIHDVNAHLRLARLAEATGDLRAALSHCEEALRVSRKLDAPSLTGPGGQRGTEWLMRAILELRRRLGRPSEGSE